MLAYERLSTIDGSHQPRWLEHTPRRKTTRKVHARRIVKKALFSEYVAKAYCISVRLPNFTNVMHRPREWVRLSCSTTFVKFGLSFRLHFGGGSPIQISLAALSDNIALCVNRKIRRFLIGGDQYSVCAVYGWLCRGAYLLAVSKILPVERT